MAAWYKDETLSTYERDYGSQRAFEREAAKAFEHGWEVASMVDHKQIAVETVAQQKTAGGGCATALVNGLFDREPEVTATYQRVKSGAPTQA